MGRHAKKIDTVYWTGFHTVVVGHGLAAGTVASTLLAAQHLPETILRMRGEVFVQGVGALGSNLSCFVTVGAILVPEGTGTSVLWSPFTDADAPWFWWEQMYIGNEESVVDTINSPLLIAARRIIDSKAMRKVRNREVQFVAENTTLATGLSVDVTVGGRILAGS